METQTVLITLITSVISSGLFSWLIKFLITRSFDKNFENFKKGLDLEKKGFQLGLDTKLEEFKAKINLLIVRGSLLINKQGETIENIYALIVDLDSAMRDLTQKYRLILSGQNPDQEAIDRKKKVNMTFAQFELYYEKKKIFLSKSLCSKIEELHNEYFQALKDYSEEDYMKMVGMEIKEPGLIKKYFNQKLGASNKVYEYIPLIKETIEMEFRKLLTVE